MKPLFTSRFRIALSTLVLVLVLTLSLAACGGGSGGDTHGFTITLTPTPSSDLTSVTVAYIVKDNNHYIGTGGAGDNPTLILKCTMPQGAGGVTFSGEDRVPNDSLQGSLTMTGPNGTGKLIKGNPQVKCTLTINNVDTVSTQSNSFCISRTQSNSIALVGGYDAVIANYPSDFPSCSASSFPTDTPTESPALTPTPSFNFDQTFDQPQYLIHATGHGTVNGGVPDDFYVLYIQEPDAQGFYQVPDGSGGTFTYSSDFHVGPLTTPRSVCEAAAARGLSAQQWTTYDNSLTFDCTLLTA